jgi:hypothetical protein
MNKLMAIILGLSAMQISLSCPFYFYNNGNKDVIIKGHRNTPVGGEEQDLLIPISADQLKLIPGIPVGQANVNTVWVYIRRTNSTIYDARYGIQEHECVPEGDPVPIVFFNLLDQRVQEGMPDKGLSIIKYIPEVHNNVDPTFSFGGR